MKYIIDLQSNRIQRALNGFDRALQVFEITVKKYRQSSTASLAGLREENGMPK